MPRSFTLLALVLKNTGHGFLDNAALQAFPQWRFKPRTVTAVEIPVRFTTKGVVY